MSKLPSNLPPGCTSADGGIDHEMEAALDNLCDAIETSDEAVLLLTLLPALRQGLWAAYKDGEEAGGMATQQMLDEALNSGDGAYRP